MFDLDAVVSQVSQNCCISDSHHAGLYSVCGLALRLRDLYKWEKDLDPWVEEESSKILDWIGDKEEEWESLADAELTDITIEGRRYDPFQTRSINEVLEPHGLFYGAGYVRSLKPTFFLAAVEEKRRVNGHGVYVLGRELARDLLTLPALIQDGFVVLRKASAKLFFWDQIFYVGKSGRPALKFALQNYGLQKQDLKSVRAHLRRIFEGEMDRYIYHELGEIQDDIFDLRIWREIIATYPHTPIELLARGVKDLLADTHEKGTLGHIAGTRKVASLGFYVAFASPLAKALFPEILKAFEEFAVSGRWNIIKTAVAAGRDRARRFAVEMIRIFEVGKGTGDTEQAAREMEKQLLVPLGIVRETGAGQ
jgi:hypothetical protein